MPQKTFYLTTPLYYVNDKPHIGHSYTNVLCDTFARFHRFKGEKVFFLTGTDEHGEKIAKTAHEKGKEVLECIEEIVPRFKELWKILGITYDYFIRTTEENHKKVVGNVIRKLYEQGDVYLGRYRGWYCTPCESFWTSVQVSEAKCPDCKRPLQEIEEENYFFKLSKYQSWLVEHIEAHPDFIFPPSRRREILSFLQNPLEDLCISRPKARLSWGIPLPVSEEHVVYVWFDALLNYISAIGFTLEEKKFRELWPADFHMVGKDILRQHAVYWPIMLKALGLEPPQRVVAHGWWMMEGAKVSKSVGNIVDPVELVGKYGADAFRYFLLREVPLGVDGSYSEELLGMRFASDLADDLGNLIHRSFGMLERYFGSEIPKASESDAAGFSKRIKELWQKVDEAMSHLDPKLALEEIWSFVDSLNKYVEDSKPWEMAKQGSERGRLANFMVTLFEALRLLGVLLAPFLPETSQRILVSLGMQEKPSAVDLQHWGRLPSGKRLAKSVPLFPKADVLA